MDKSNWFLRHTIGGTGDPVTSHFISTLSPTLAVKWFVSKALSSETTDTPNDKNGAKVKEFLRRCVSGQI